MHNVAQPDHSFRVRRKSEALPMRTDELHNISRSYSREIRESIYNQVAEYDEQLSAIAALQLSIEQCSSSLQALDLIAREALRLTNAEGCAIAMDFNGGIECRARAGALAPDLGTPIDPASGLTGECWRTGEVVRCDDTDSDARVSIDCRSSSIRSVLVVPLLKRKQVIGVAAVFSSRIDGFHTRETRVLQLLAGVAAQQWTAPPTADSSLAQPCAPVVEECVLTVEEPCAMGEDGFTRARDLEPRVSAPPAWRCAGSKQITRCLDVIRQDPALRLLGHAKTYLALESIYDGIDRSGAVSLFDGLMFARAEELGVALS